MDSLRGGSIPREGIGEFREQKHVQSPHYANVPVCDNKRFGRID